jgi:hypothetical protein
MANSRFQTLSNSTRSTFAAHSHSCTITTTPNLVKIKVGRLSYAPLAHTARGSNGQIGWELELQAGSKIDQGTAHPRMSRSLTISMTEPVPVWVPSQRPLSRVSGRLWARSRTFHLAAADPHGAMDCD